MSVIGREAIGLGLRAAWYADVATRADLGIDFFEVIGDNHLDDAALPAHHLRRARGRAPVVVHGVGLDLLGADPLDAAHLRGLRRLAESLDSPWVTEHLCWTAVGGRRSHDLLPAPRTWEVVRYAVDRVRAVQDALGRPFGVENLAAMLGTREDELDEWAFIGEVIDRADCGLLLDLNNLWVSSRNLGYDPERALELVDGRRVLYAHLAGQQGASTGPIVDTHDAPVRPEVWALYGRAWERLGPFPTLLEWDAALPAYGEAVAEAGRARGARAGLGSEGGARRGRVSPAVREAAGPAPVAPARLRAWQEALLGLLREAPTWSPPEVSFQAAPPTLVAQVDEAGGIPAIERLAAYHRQVWFRWITALQEEHPLLVQALGLWAFNQLATSHLQARPPDRADIASVADGLDGHLRGSRWDSARAREAVAVDRARRELLRLPPCPTWTPPAEEAALAEARLRLAPTVRRLDLRWAWPAVRGEAEPEERPATWLVLRTPELALGEVEVEPALARLLTLLEGCALGEALARLEGEVGDVGRVGGWLRAGVRWGWWAAEAVSQGAAGTPADER